ncbi:MAG: WXG100 family type VII secretion target [Planctomycetota bacterium]|nr:MAG: WXG100 family type VII secretion target [Planctomycetota bacterium]
MAKAVADPEEIRRFAQTLKRFSTGLSQQMSQVSGQMASLGQTWRDQEHAKFANEFEQTLRQLARFNEAVDEQIPFLLRKADRLEEYLRQR